LSGDDAQSVHLPVCGEGIGNLFLF